MKAAFDSDTGQAEVDVEEANNLGTKPDTEEKKTTIKAAMKKQK